MPDKILSQVCGVSKNYTSLLYSEITKTGNLFDEKKTKKIGKKMKQSHAYRDYASTYNVEILNS